MGQDAEALHASGLAPIDGGEQMGESVSNTLSEVESRNARLVARLESEAAIAPARYKRRILLLSLLGYIYPIIVVIGLFATLAGAGFVIFSTAPGAGVIGLKFILLPLLALAFAILRSLWVRLPPPEGRPVSRVEAPRLFALCDQLAKRLQAPRVHRILVTADFNAGIVQIPRLGLFGWPKNYLCIGLPLTLALSPKQFEAVLAHEYGHLAGSHGRFSARIYRMRQTWALLAAALHEQSRWGAFLFAPFFNWYAPYFNAYSFVLARAHEYDADRHSADVVGSRVTADALTDVAVRGETLLADFWPAFWKHADDSKEPPYPPFERMSAFFKRPLDTELAERALQSNLAMSTDMADTHPCLTDRINALGQAARMPGALEDSAAEYLFDQYLPDLVRSADAEWRSECLPAWRERYQQVVDGRRKLAKLNDKAKTVALNADQSWRRATLVEELDGAVAALPLYRSLLQTDPDHAGATFAVGRIMLWEKDAGGLEFLERAMKLDDEAIVPGCVIAFQFLMDQGRKTEAQAYSDRAQRKMKGQEQILAEQPVASVEVDEVTVEEEIWNRHNTEGLRALDRGDYAEAADWFESAVIEAERFGPDDQRLAASRDNLERVRRVGQRADEGG